MFAKFFDRFRKPNPNQPYADKARADLESAGVSPGTIFLVVQIILKFGVPAFHAMMELFKADPKAKVPTEFK